MTSLQQIDNYEFYASLYPIIRDPGWDVGYITPRLIRFLRESPFDNPADDRQRTWAIIGTTTARIGVAAAPNWSYCWQARMTGSGAGSRIIALLDIPLDSSPEFAYEAARAKAEQWFDAKTRQLLIGF
jgi:hypothetical protein